MKTLKNILMIILINVSLVSVFGSALNTASAASDSSSCDKKILTLPPWYRGLTKSDDKGECNIISPNEMEGNSQDDKLKKFITIILLNVGEIALQLAGYVSVIFVTYGGYKYMMSEGEAGGIQSAKKTIANALIGLVISLLAVGIIKLVFNALE